MPFNEKSRLDTSQVQDRRGRGLGTTMAAGGAEAEANAGTQAAATAKVYSRAAGKRSPRRCCLC